MKTLVKPHLNGVAKPTKSKAAKGVADTAEVYFSNVAGKTPLHIDAICESLLKLASDWPKTISGVLCYLDEDEVRPLKSASDLFAWIGSHMRVDWRRGSRAVPKEELFRRLMQRSRWNWATRHPHFPQPVSDVLYLAEPPPAENNGKLNELLDHFRPKTTEDRELIRAMILTFFWSGPPGKRPQFVIAADENKDTNAGRGDGKTSLIQHLSRLVGGCIDVDPSDRNHILTNLLSPSSWGQRVVLIDNLKASRFSNDLLEKLITRDDITGHRLYDGFGKRPNLLTWVVTVNGAFFSTDMAQRSIVIRLKRPPSEVFDWDSKVQLFIDENREAIVADVRWHLEKQPATLNKIDRWRSWCLGVLSRCENPNELLGRIKTQRDVVDGDKAEIELSVDHLRSCIATELNLHPDPKGEAQDIDTVRVWMPTAWLVQALRMSKRDFTDRQAQQYLPRLSTTGRLMEKRRNDQRGYLWMGKDASETCGELQIGYRPEVR